MMIRFPLLALLALPVPAAAQDAPALYGAHCAACHGDARLGGIGPALIPETLGRMRGTATAEVIAEGRPSTQMPAFAGTLRAGEIAALAAYLSTPLDHVPEWGPAEIAASRAMAADYAPAPAPAFDADPLNLFVVVETGDHQVSVLDGDTFAVLDRFPTPFAVHGGPKFSPDGRFVHIMSRDGWVQKYDLWSLAEVGRVRAGLNSRNIALSADGRWLAVANALPATLTILDAETLEPARVIDVAMTGACVETNAALAEGDRLIYASVRMGRRPAEVMWCEDGRAGLKFTDEDAAAAERRGLPPARHWLSKLRRATSC